MLTYLMLLRENGPSNPTAPISAGFYRLDPGTPLVYTYTYDEMKIIVDGDFEISDQSGQTAKAKKGDGTHEETEDHAIIC